MQTVQMHRSDTRECEDPSSGDVSGNWESAQASTY